MANGAVIENANASDSGETLVSSIRPGMKREFSMMMKSQGGIVFEMGQRRTRSQNSASNNKGPAKNGGDSDVNHNSMKLKGSSAKKMKKEVGNEVVDGEPGKVEGVAGVKGLKDNGAGKNGEKAGLVTEEEEPKSDLVDGNSDDEMKGNLVEEGIAGGEEKKIELEKLGSEMEIDMGKVVGADYTREAVIVEEPRDGVVEGMNEDLQIGKEISVQMESVIEVDNAVEISNVGEKGGVTMSALDEKALRRFSHLGENAIIPGPTPSKLEMKMSKKVELKKTPTKLKELLETGLLEGLKVQYIRGIRARAPGEAGLSGVIQGSGILCFCKICKGAQVVTPNQFEIHAASGNKRPPEYIYLENGRTLRDVLNACKGAPFDSLELTIRKAVGCEHSKGAKHPVEFRGSSASPRSEQSPTSKGNELTASQMDNSSTSNIRPPLKSSKMPSSHSRSKIQGRLTRKDLRLHKLIFESDLLPDGTELGYFSGAQRMLSGHKSGHGIYCDCCHKVVSPSTFEAHAGFGSRRKPYANIYVSNGASLHMLSIEIKKSMKPSIEDNDDVCNICQSTGELLCCDGCPRAFHQECVDLQSVPQGIWYCRLCEGTIVKDGMKAQHNANAKAAGWVAGADPMEDIKNRCIRILDIIENDDGGCVLCRGHKFSESEFGPFTVMLCDQCENEYHVGCLKEHEMDDLKELPDGKWFCRSECRSIHSALQKLVADGERRLPDSVLEVIEKKHGETGSEDNFDLNITWRLLHGKTASEEDRKWLSAAVSVFHERFDPIAVNTTQDDLIPFMIDGGNEDQDFGGMYCAILVVNAAVVSAGLFRVFGQELAEIPLVATSSGCQGKGYFQSLFWCIEDFLASLEVRNLVLPAAHEAKYIWMNKFGFEKITKEQLREYRKDYPIMVFQGTSVLQKPLPKLESA